MPLNTAVAAGVIPFIPGDLAKILLATFIGPQIRK
ncbi:biotin transporter BioY [Calorimonas adulescens]